MNEPSLAKGSESARRDALTIPVPIDYLPDRDGADPAVALIDRERGTQWLLPQTNRFVIGSGIDADVIVDRHRVSRQHCTIERRGTWLYVKDHSKNGTFLGARPVPEFVIWAGQQFRIGHTV